MSARRKLTAACAAIGLGLTAAALAAAPPVFAGAFDGWYEDAAGYEEAMEKGAGRSKPVAVFFYTDWCPACRRMTRELLAESDVQKALKPVLKVFINPEHGRAENMLAARYGVAGYPSFFVHASDGSGAREIGLKVGADGRLSQAAFIHDCLAAARLESRPSAAPSRASPIGSSAAEPSRTEALPGKPVRVYLKSGGVVSGSLLENTAAGVLIAWPMGSARFDHSLIDHIE